MKVNDIRKLAKEIRTGNCNLGFDEISKIAAEIEEYVNSEAAAGWTDRTKNAIKADALDIARYIESVRPEETSEKIEETEEIVRKNFKTVVAEMAGKRFPILEAVRWFATVYARDGYDKTKCIRGMLERRGYGIADTESGFDVMNPDRTGVVANVRDNNGVVGGFEIVVA